MMTTVKGILKKSGTTGIGSLPHHNVDAALEFSMKHTIPFLPQIPIRNPWEFMIAQALEGLPGLQAESDGTVFLNMDIWHSRTHTFQARLDDAFASHDAEAFEAFEPSAASSSCWQPFLWELEERGFRSAKIQIAGPLTSQWALRFKDGSRVDQHPDLATQIYRLVLARSLAMIRRMKASAITPILYLDEPALYGFSLNNPKHMLGLQELKLMVQTLKKEDVLLGLHCCSNTDWGLVLALNLDLISVDTSLSLDTLLSEKYKIPLENFIKTGGRLSLGVIPTTRSAALHSLPAFEANGLFAQMMDSFGRAWGNQPDLVKKVLHESIYTPACGLALHSVADAELVLEILTEFYDFCIHNERK